MNALTVFDPQSPQARAIYHLAIIAGIIFAVIFAIVSGMIVYALMRCRWREGEGDRKQIAQNKTVELVGTVIPFLMVVTLLARRQNTGAPQISDDVVLVRSVHHREATDIEA
jgi:heme/copper-type cytochrome/quinol oxidase subunit 2